MKVLFVTREYPPFEVGGVAKHTFYLVKYLRKLELSCKVLSFGDSSGSNEDTVFVDPSSSILSRSNCSIALDAKIPFDVVRLGRVANSLIRREGFDVVHVEEPYVGAFVRHGRKVTTVHDTSYGEVKAILHHPSGFPDLKRAAFYLSLGTCSELMCAASSRVVIVPSFQVKEELVRVYRVPEGRIRVIRNGVELPESVDKERAKQGLGLSPAKPLIFTSAQHVARKRLDTLVEAVKIICEGGVEGFHVVMGGDGPLRPYILNLVKRLGVDQAMDLPGWIPEDQLGQYYEAADIFVLTSEYEAGPMSMLEAMSHGTCVVSSRIDGFPRYISDGVDGLLFPVGDAQALSSCIRRLLDDAHLREGMSSSARVFARRFDWESVAEETKRLYESML